MSDIHSISIEIRDTLIDVLDFPKPGILFKDVTPVFGNPALCKRIIEELTKQYGDQNIDYVIGLESRGFLLGMPLALALNVPFVMVRKKGKLPRDTYAVSYELEYGTATIELHKNTIKSGARVLIHDDVLATGGTAEAAARLVKMANAQVCGFSFLISIEKLNGTKKLEQIGAPIHIFTPC
jgi:adenine phosphoribosyltransferase